MKCADATEQTIDFLYDELGAEGRRAFEGHLATCPSCRDELEGMRATLGIARSTLAVGNDPVPAHLHTTLAEIAGLAARKGTGALRPVGDPVIPEGAGGVWGWLRKPWLFPAFAAASVMGLFLLAREVLLPDDLSLGVPPAPYAAAPRTPRAAPNPAPVAAEPKGSAPAPVAQPAFGGIATGALSPAADEALAAREAESAGLPPGGGGLVGAVADVRRAPAKKQRLADSTADESDDAPLPARRSLAKTAVSNGPPGTMRLPAAIPIAAPYGRSREQRRDRQPVAAAAASPEAALRERSVGSEGALIETSTASAKENDDSSVAPRAVALDGAGAVKADFAARGKAGVLTEPRLGAARPRDDINSQAALIDVANRLFAEGRMADAATIYKTLVDRFPMHPDVGTWKARLEKATANVAAKATTTSQPRAESSPAAASPPPAVPPPAAVPISRRKSAPKPASPSPADPQNQL